MKLFSQAASVHKTSGSQANTFRWVCGSVLLLGAFLISPLSQAQGSSLTQDQQMAVRAIVKDALINDPSLLKEAIIALQVREQQLAELAQQDKLDSHQLALYETKSDPWIGAADPEIVMVYFTDFNCPYCKKIEPSLKRLTEEYPQLKIVVKMVPLQGEFSRAAVDLAQTVWLNEPEKYLRVKDMLMSSPRRLDAASIAKVAKLTNTDMWLNKTDERVANMVSNNVNLMRELGLGGTPSMLIGDTVIPGLVPYEQLKEQLEQVIDQKVKF